jgi:hypothetical protein
MWVFVRTYLGAAAGFSLLVAAINLVVDPYNLIDGIRVLGLNEKKPDIFSHSRLYKAYAAWNIRPEAIALGNSRTDCGIDPDHPGWSLAANGHFNLGLSGAHIYETKHYFRHALALGKVKQVVLGLDPYSFGHNKTTADFRAGILAHESGVIGLYGWQRLAYFFSSDALRSSLRTISAQDRPAVSFFRNGQRAPDFFAYDIQQHRGYRNYFLKADKTTVRSLCDSKVGCTSFFNPENLQELREILHLARTHNVDLRLFISPVHARMLEITRMAGLWPDWEAWRRQVVALLAEEAARYPDHSVPLWDFSGYNTYTAEAVPPKNDPAPMQWYWESSHYKKELGDRVLDRVFGYQAPERTVAPDFGVLLTSANIEEHLASIRSAQARYEAEHPEDLTELALLFEDDTKMLAEGNAKAHISAEAPTGGLRTR